MMHAVVVGFGNGIQDALTFLCYFGFCLVESMY
jgi:hypothetical protein